MFWPERLEVWTIILLKYAESCVYLFPFLLSFMHPFLKITFFAVTSWRLFPCRAKSPR
jgi:hypothetical protein